MLGIVYLTECIDESCGGYGKKYIGQHKTDSTDFDGYLGSGKLLCRYVEKYGRDAFKRTTLAVCDTQETLDEYEKYYINLYKESYPEDILNLHEGGTGGWDYYNSSPHEHPRGMLGKPQTEYQKSHQSSMMIGNKLAVGNQNAKRRVWSEDSRKKLSESLRGKVSPHRGIPLSEEQKQLLSLAQQRYYENHSEAREERSRILSEQNTGRVWVTNGVENRFIYEEDLQSLPGYHKGRVCTNASKIGMIFINNGTVNKQIPGDSEIPEGWVRGMLKKSGWKKGVSHED